MMPGATVIPDVAALVEVPADGTLSRVLAKNETVRLVGFGFDAGQELTEHTSASAAIVQVLSGRIELAVGGGGHEMGPASWAFLPPHEPHSLRALDQSVVLLTLVRAGGPATEEP